MRSAGNFSPEWGYLAPAPSFMRTARVVIVATAIGATAGAGVVLSLVDRPTVEADKTPLAARAIVTSVQAAPVATVTPVATATVPNVAAPAKPTVATSAPSAAPPAPATPRIQAEAPAKTQSAVIAPPAALSMPASPADTAPAAVPAYSASGVAALSDTPPAADKPASDIPNLAIAAPEPTTPPKKTKTAAPNKPQGLGTVLQRLFSANGNRQSVH